MAKLKLALTDEQVRKLGVAKVREAYKELARQYNKIVNGELLFCAACNEFHPIANYYNDKRYAIGVFPQCKKCLLEEATDYDKKTDTYTDNKEKTIAVFRKLDLPFIESSYNNAIKDLGNEFGEKNRGTAYQTLTVVVRSLPQHRGKTFADSEFQEEDEPIVQEDTNRHARNEIKKLFGAGFTESDYVYLQDQYDDWRARVQIDSKSAETYIVRICFKLLDIWKAQKAGKDTKELDKTLNDLMAAANLQPKQNASNAAADTLTFGQLIEKWEQEEPIPEPDEEFKDVNHIGKLIRVFFTGWLAKALGLKNAYSQECEEYIQQYEVTPPSVNDEGSASDIYDKLFGGEGNS